MNIEKLIDHNREMKGIVILLNDTPIIFLLHQNEMLDGIRFEDKEGQFKNLRDDQFVYVTVNFIRKAYFIDNHFGHYDYEITPLSTYSIQGDGPKINIMRVIKDGEFKNVVKSAINS